MIDSVLMGIQISIFIILILAIIISLYIMNRNWRVFLLRGFLLDKAHYYKSNFRLIMNIYERYSYYDMIYSFRSMKSFKKEFFDEINKIKRKTK